MDSVFELAKSEEIRRDFIRHLENRHPDRAESNREMSEYVLSKECLDDLARLEGGEYFLSVPRAVTRKTHTKERLLYMLPLRQKSLCSLLKFAANIRYDDRFSDKVYSHRPKRNINSILISMRESEAFGNCYVLMADIKGFGPGIRVQDLHPAIDSFFADDRKFADFLKWLSGRTEYIKDEVLFHDATCIKEGIPLFELMENVFLSEIDEILEKEASFYSRYGDDMIVGVESRDKLKEIKAQMEEYLGERGLTLHPDKTIIIDKGETFEYLGMKVTGNEIDFCDAYVNRILRSIKKETKKLARRQAEKKLPQELVMFFTIQKVERYLQEMCVEDAFSLISTDKSLRILDRAITDLIRSAASGVTGSKRYRIKYKTLTKWGYKSLVNRYYSYLEKGSGKRGTA